PAAPAPAPRPRERGAPRLRFRQLVTRRKRPEHISATPRVRASVENGRARRCPANPVTGKRAEGPMSVRASWLLLAVVLASPGAPRAAHPACQGGGEPAGTAPPDTSAAPAIDLTAVQPVASTPADFPRGRISGNIFGDIYYNVNGDPAHTYTPAGADLGQPN